MMERYQSVVQRVDKEGLDTDKCTLLQATCGVLGGGVRKWQEAIFRVSLGLR